MQLGLWRFVPMDLMGNLAFRIEVRERCEHDLAFRAAIMQACKEDVLFFILVFCWLYEPRPRYYENGKLKPKTIPFIPWMHQIPGILTIRKNLGTGDVVVFKSRGEGFSWIAILLALHDWLFGDMVNVGLVSNTEKKTDTPGNMDSLMAKLDWEITKLPVWMVGKQRSPGRTDGEWSRNRADHSFVNYRTGGQINGFAATPDCGRAGRYAWFLGDEIAFWDPPKDTDFLEAIRESTDSRLLISTPNGSNNAFHDAVHSASSAIKVRVHWSDNDYKNRGLYKLLGGVPVQVRSDIPLAPEYNPPSQAVLDRWSRLRNKGFKLEDTVRSPWYDLQCDRLRTTPQSIAKELDLSFGGSMFRVFTSGFFKKADATVSPPLLTGNISYHPETLDYQFIPDDLAPFRFWTSLDSNGRPPRRRYTVTADISSGLAGSHTSNSTIVVFDAVSMSQAAAFASNCVQPRDFADLCVVVARMFWDAHLGWEANFDGGFVKRVLDLKYPNLYRRKVLWKRSKQATMELGWHTNPRSKDLMFSDMLSMVESGEVILRDADLVKECAEYIRTGPQSEIRHKASIASGDESSQGKAHGDRVIAAAIGIQLLDDRKSMAEDPAPAGDPPPDTLAYRVKMWGDEEKDEFAWDDRSNWELAHARA